MDNHSPQEESEAITINGPNGYDSSSTSPTGTRSRISLGPPPTSQNRGHTRSFSSSGLPPSPSSAGPYRTSFAPNGSPPLSSPFRANFAPNGHSRQLSTSAYIGPPSPLGHGRMSSASTLPNLQSGLPQAPQITTSYSNPESNNYTNGTPPSPVLNNKPVSVPNGSAAAAAHKRRHSRMHSRNLSVFFPRPGSIPASTISEDYDASEEVEAPVSTIPAAGSSVHVRNTNPPLTPLGQGFKFGSKPPPSEIEQLVRQDPEEDETASFPRPKRRGHHHKHSLSHNFFSFLEPTVNRPTEELQTLPAPIPQSPWAPISAIADKTTFGPTATAPQAVYSDGLPVPAVTVGLVQFLLGAWLWVSGQQIGSLSCTGLGYWVVFDAFGVGVGRVAPAWLARPPKGTSAVKQKIRRPYGNGRMETVLMFSQAVYLMFSAVYICKETVEHMLLSAGGQEGHHHHSGDEHPQTGIDFPIVMIFLTFASLLSTAFFYENNSQLVNLSGNRLPSLNSFARSLFSKRSTQPDAVPTDPLAIVLTNPFVACPLLVSASLLFIPLFLSPTHHRLADLALSSITAVLTFNVAYRASVVLGAVLLQTAPPKGMPSGKLESFHRAVREIERHPHVSHLPAPHIWQLTPSLTSQAASALVANGGGGKGGKAEAIGSSFSTDQLVVTMEIHVKPDLGDDDVLALTKWAWERCVNALGGSKEFREVGEVGGPEISVGVVRG